MKIKKNLVQLVQSDYTPLQTNAEGLLRGGFGSVQTTHSLGQKIKLNFGCKTNPECEVNYCTINKCSTKAPGTSPSPKPTAGMLSLGF